MKYKFNFDKWVINHFGKIASAVMTGEERKTLLKNALKRNGELFVKNDRGHQVGTMSIDIGSFGVPYVMVSSIRKEDCDVVEGDEKKFSYDLWKKENKNQEDDIVAKYDGMALSRIKEIANSFSAYPNGMFVVDGEFCIDKKKEMK